VSFRGTTERVTDVEQRAANGQVTTYLRVCFRDVAFRDGSLRSSFCLRTARHAESCGFRFATGTRYYVEANNTHAEASDVSLETGTCNVIRKEN
jgi:hypothetical protein